MRYCLFRIMVFISATALAGYSVADSAGHAFPYIATVVGPSAQLHSGPSDDYYATEVLPQDARVEVYREAPGGWLGIRPPEGSYSWVFSRHVEVLSDRVGRINKDEVASRIGSLEGERREVVQVRLHADEYVALLNYANDPDALWLKIKPPSGEFRWVRADDIQVVESATLGESDRQPTAVESESVVADSGPNVAAAENTTPAIELPDSADQTDEITTVTNGWTQQEPAPEPKPTVALATSEVPVTDEPANAPSPSVEPALPPAVPLNDSGWVATAAHHEPVSQLPPPSTSPTATAVTGQAQSPPPLLENPPPPKRVAEDPRFKPPGRVDPTAPPQTPAPPLPPATTASAARAENAIPAVDPREFSIAFAKKLTEIDLRLSQTVSQDRRQWQLEMLERDAELLLTRAQTVAEREAAKHTLAKIDRFASIQRRSERVAATPPPISATPPVAAAFPPPPTAFPQPSTPVSQPAYANQQWLGPPPTGTQPLVATAPPAPNAGQAYPVEARPSHPLIRNSPRRYNAVGYLRPVRSRSPNVPQYALTDEAGQILTFVTPTPDVDPEPFLGQRVGIRGQSERRPGLREPHVTAGRISPLGPPLRR